MQLLPGGRLASPQMLLNLALGRRFALGLDARWHPLQPVFLLQLAHDDLLPLVVVAVAGHAAVKADAVRQDVDVLVVGIDVPRHHKLVVFQAHVLHIPLPNLAPLLITELFTRRGG
ncbi:hypothetical protein [Janthinobacterium sp. TND4EL3]|uniref:hypothetical protein n=1 Tax=Janthinobacterium sp. TND4EL3 TaxID=1907311 RepID=UPI001FCCE995|nr:hypothetical protein [Janthinobacterium sp. TND4EL3]